MEFEKVKSYLSQQCDDNGTSIYSHIAAISRKIVEEKPENPYQCFENISLEVKQSKLNNNNDIIPVPNESERQEIQSNINSILTAYGRKPEPVKKEKTDEDEEEEQDEEEPAEEEPVDISKCANILQHQQLLNYAGIVFEYEECYQSQQAFLRLIKKFGENIESSRFWGKIEGIYNDYYIIEAKLAEEERGEDINEYIYFVTTDIGGNGEWIKLNDITAEQIKKSREIYRLFTGNLDSKIGGRVHFEWTEAELLRAQIARISSSTIIAPNEYYQRPEDQDDGDDENGNSFNIVLNEEYAPNEDGGIGQDSWVHSRPHLRLQGTHKKVVKSAENDEDADENEEDGDDEDEKEEKEPSPEELEEEIPILRGIGEDKCGEFNVGGNEEDDNEESESSKCWFIRELNKNMPYKVVVINNKIWNGAKTIYVSNTKTFLNIYIGNGIKYRQQYYTPTPPAMIQAQFNEFKETEIPNPENEEETITKQESMFVVQTEQMPPPPEPKEDEAANEENEENADEQEAE